MKPRNFRLLRPLGILVFTVAVLGSATGCFGAATFTQQIDPSEVTVGDQVVVTLTVQNGSLGRIQLPPVDGLQLAGTSIQLQSMDDNGVSSTALSFSFALIPMRPGNFVIPAFDLHTKEGDVLHVKPMKLHVLDNGSRSSNNVGNPIVPVPSPNATSAPNSPANSQGPVVMPPPQAGPAPNTADVDNSVQSDSGAPRDKDGHIKKVFLIITPQTTDAYVGQAIPMQIDFYIRMDVNAEQNSLPTIQGSDFLMNNFMTRGHENVGTLEDEQYERESWVTAISAPKSGDFSLRMARDTYWVKSMNVNNNFGPFSGFFNRRPDLAHEEILSNQPTIHVHPLPTEGRPANFFGAIGDFKVSGTAQSGPVAVGEPVSLHFTVSGEGNFDYVRSPTLADDPAWKAYTPQSKTEYMDEAHTRAVKTFDQSVIPQKNGTLLLPPANFSYFDPGTKHYVTLSVTLPSITVTGSALPVASTSPPDNGTGSVAAAVAPKANEFAANRPDIGSPRFNLTPAYRQPWFWISQGGLLALLMVGALLLVIRARRIPSYQASAERASRRRSLQQEEDAMAEAVRRNDAVAFFLAARHGIQLQLGAQWRMKPEALTLGEIRSHDLALAETLAPLFNQADQVIYSGEAAGNVDLTAWEQRVRTEFLQTQSA